MAGVMIRILVREIVIFFSFVILLPLAVLSLLGGGEGSYGVQAFARFLTMGMATFPLQGPAGRLLFIFLKLTAPYLAFQAFRAYLWAGTGPVGRKWANLYFTVLLGAIAVRSLWKAWDLFYFMYALGDMPAEIRQFFEIEGLDVAIFGLCSLLAIRCFLVFLDPYRGMARPTG